jgi:hypothetical protein
LFRAHGRSQLLYDSRSRRLPGRFRCRLGGRDFFLRTFGYCFDNLGDRLGRFYGRRLFYGAFSALNNAYNAFRRRLFFREVLITNFLRQLF